MVASSHDVRCNITNHWRHVPRYRSKVNVVLSSFKECHFFCRAFARREVAVKTAHISLSDFWDPPLAKILWCCIICTHSLATTQTENAIIFRQFLPWIHNFEYFTKKVVITALLCNNLLCTILSTWPFWKKVLAKFLVYYYKVTCHWI